MVVGGQGSFGTDSATTSVGSDWRARRRRWSAAMAGTFRQQLRLALRESWTASQLFSSVPQAAVLGWLAQHTTSPAVLTRFVVGAFLVTLWNFSSLRVSGSLTNELMAGTYELSVVSRTPVVISILAKTAAYVCIGAGGGLISAAGVVLIAGHGPQVHSPMLVVAGVVVAVSTLVATTLVLAPFAVLGQGRSSLFTLFVPLGAILGGFVYPLSSLPVALEVAGRCLPMSWGTAALMDAVSGGSGWGFVGDAAMALTLAALWTVVASVLFERVQRRLVRIGAVFA